MRQATKLLIAQPDGYAIVRLSNGRFGARCYTGPGRWFHLPPTTKRFCDAWQRIQDHKRKMELGAR